MEERLMRVLREVVYILKTIGHKNGALWRSASERFTRREIRRNETADMWNDRYEVNHCRGSSEMPNQVERRRSKTKWSRVSKAAKRQRWQTQDTC